MHVKSALIQKTAENTRKREGMREKYENISAIVKVKQMIKFLSSQTFFFVSTSLSFALQHFLRTFLNVFITIIINMSKNLCRVCFFSSFYSFVRFPLWRLIRKTKIIFNSLNWIIFYSLHPGICILFGITFALGIMHFCAVRFDYYFSVLV